MSDDVADRAEAALEGVTDGPWVSWKQRQHFRDQGGIYRGNVVSDATKQIIVTQTGNVANSEFIAAARSLVPELVAELKTTRAQLAAVRELHKPRWLNCINYCCSGEECRNRYRGCICDEEWPCSTARQVYSADELGAAEAVTDA